MRDSVGVFGTPLEPPISHLTKHKHVSVGSLSDPRPYFQTLFVRPQALGPIPMHLSSNFWPILKYLSVQTSHLHVFLSDRTNHVFYPILVAPLWIMHRIFVGNRTMILQHTPITCHVNKLCTIKLFPIYSLHLIWRTPLYWAKWAPSNMVLPNSRPFTTARLQTLPSWVSSNTSAA